MSKPYLKQATTSDAQSLGPRLRQEDVEELRLSSDIDPTVTLTMGVATADVALSICHPSKGVAAICGITNYQSDGLTIGYPWLLASDLVNEIKVPFLRGSRSLDAFLARKSDLLTNLADPRNDLHIKWLKHCGYHFTQHVTRRAGYPPLIEFVRIP